MFAVFLSAAVPIQDYCKIGMLQGFTGPTESLVIPIVSGGELAIEEISDSGLFLGGKKILSVRGDTTCIDTAAATATADRLITLEGVAGIIGTTCSGATTAVLNNVVRPHGVVMISPSATSPALSLLEDDGLFFRTAPSDARQGEIIGDILFAKGIKSAALTYTNNDYGKGLAEAIRASFEKNGGKITVVVAHEDGKADYTAEVATMASAGGDILIVVGYLDQGGKRVIQAAMDTGAFEKFMLPDGMVGDSLTNTFGKTMDGSIGIVQGNDSLGSKMLVELAKRKGFNGNDPYFREAYDACAIMLLAMQSAGTTDSNVYKYHINKVANSPGEKIYPGELAKALKILADGAEIDYVGSTAVELIAPGESFGSFSEKIIINGTWNTVSYH
ncbi:ABC transporter substrate-binding protein [Candidatus Endolissoclinum faulkneri]|uniref:ABC transporter substrate-binding protein n=1 Tax=Candidatus Endolissoclinum faulkneri TaxID=1263979 RepID=UPI001D03F2AC|nr:ABC transporter substrate-binding protein [Candidatus Endolissoclinum faulkneri]